MKRAYGNLTERILAAIAEAGPGTAADLYLEMPEVPRTHASPRLHDRRGHWRKYPSGKVGWVKNCKVGDASRGVVFKDYEVKQ